MNVNCPIAFYRETAFQSHLFPCPLPVHTGLLQLIYSVEVRAGLWLLPVSCLFEGTVCVHKATSDWRGLLLYSFVY